MVKSPQRPTSKSRSAGSTRSRAAKSSAASSGKPTGPTGSKPAGEKSSQTASTKAKPAESATQLTPKPTTIDLTANAVKKTAAAVPETGASKGPQGGQTTEKTSDKSTGKVAGTDQPTSAAEEKPAGTAQPADQKATGSKSDTSASGSSQPSRASTGQPRRSEPASAHAQTRRGGGTSILAMVLAGGVGGIITLLGAYALLGSGLLATMQNDGTDETQAQLSELSGSVTALSDQSTALSESLADLDTRLTALADQPADTGDTEALQADIDALRRQIDGVLASAQSDGAASDAAVTEMQESLSALETRMTDLSDALTSQNETLSAELSKLADQQTALESSIASGEAGDGPALTALETRLTNLSEQMAAQADQINTQISAQISALGTEIPSPVREELNTIGEIVTNLQAQLSIMESLQLTSQQQQIDLQSLTDAVEGVAGTVKRVAGKTDRLEETVATPADPETDVAMDGARLAYVQDALQTAVSEGMPFTGLLAQAQTLMADNGSDVALPDDFLQAAQSGLTPVSVLASQIGDARAAYDAKLVQAIPAAETDTDDDSITARGLLDGIWKGAKGLVEVRKIDETEAAPPDSLSGQLAAAQTAAATGDLVQLSASLEEIAGNAATSQTLQNSVSLWLDQARHHQTAAGLQDQLDAIQQSIWADASKGDPS